MNVASQCGAGRPDGSRDEDDVAARASCHRSRRSRRAPGCPARRNCRRSGPSSDTGVPVSAKFLLHVKSPCPSQMMPVTLAQVAVSGHLLLPGGLDDYGLEGLEHSVGVGVPAQRRIDRELDGKEPALVQPPERNAAATRTRRAVREIDRPRMVASLRQREGSPIETRVVSRSSSGRVPEFFRMPVEWRRVTRPSPAHGAGRNARSLDRSRTASSGRRLRSVQRQLEGVDEELGHLVAGDFAGWAVQSSASNRR